MHELLHLIAVANVLHDIFGPLVDGMRGLLRAFHRWGVPWGFSIVILTIIVRTFLLPLTIKQYRSAAAMTALQPKIKELQRKYKKDRAKLQQETMRLYQEHSVNPLSSCLPMLVQLPVFLCLYYAIRNTPELKAASFLWLPELGKPDPYYILFALYIITQIVSTELMMAPETDKQQKLIMRAMPIFFVAVLFRFPSGLFVYWVTTNMWTIGQQAVIRRRIHRPGVQLAPAKPKRESRIMKALTEAQQRQQQRVTSVSGDDQADSDEDEGSKPATRPRQGGRPASKGGQARRPGNRPAGGKPRPGGGKPRPASGKRPNRPSGSQ